MTDQPVSPVDPAPMLVVDGDGEWTAAAVAELFQTCHERLRRCVMAWMPDALGGKFGAEDVLQEAVMSAIRNPQRMTTLEVAPFVWFRALARDALTQRVRAFLATEKRGRLEESLDRRVTDLETSRRICQAMADDSLSPSSVARHQESAELVQRAVAELSDIDQETISLLFFEGLTTSEAAEVLKIADSSMSMRKLRALSHLKRVLRQAELTKPDT